MCSMVLPRSALGGEELCLRATLSGDRPLLLVEEGGLKIMSCADETSGGVFSSEKEELWISVDGRENTSVSGALPPGPSRDLTGRVDAIRARGKLGVLRPRFDSTDNLTRPCEI